MSAACWLMCALCCLTTTAKWTASQVTGAPQNHTRAPFGNTSQVAEPSRNYTRASSGNTSQVTLSHHTITTASSELSSFSTTEPLRSITSSISQEMILSTSTITSTSNNASGTRDKGVNLTEEWSTVITGVQNRGKASETVINGTTSQVTPNLDRTVPPKTPGGVSQNKSDMGRTLFPKSPNPYTPHTTSLPTDPTSPTIHTTSPTTAPVAPTTHLTSPNLHQTTVDWLSTFLLPNVSVESCPSDCQCSAESLYDGYARLYFQKTVAKPALYLGLGSPSFTDFRAKLLPPPLLSSMGKDGFIKLASTNKAYVDCRIKETTWSIDDTFESHFTGLDLANTFFNLTLRCSAADTEVVWAAHNINLDTLTVHGCSHVVQHRRIKTAIVFSKFFVTNSSEDWIDSFEMANNTISAGSIDIRSTRFTQLPGILYRDNPLHLNTLRLLNVSLRQWDCEVMSIFMGVSTLDLAHNHLTKIEDCFLPASMETLNVSFNNIDDLSVLEFPRFVRAFNLSTLDLCGNQITTLKPFTQMNINVLSLCKNSVETIEQLTFLQLSHIYILDLSWNKISNIQPGAFRFLYYIEFLDLSHNHLVSLAPETSPGVPCNMDISYNRFHHPAFSSRNFETTSALGLTAHHNPYYCDCDLSKLQAFVARDQNKDLYKRLRQSLDLTFMFNKTYPSQLFSLDELTCAYPENLRGERMVDVVFNSSCPIVDNCPVGCECINNHAFVVVDCAFHELTSLPDVMPNGILHLNFHDNNISTLSVRDYLSRTQVLNLSRNVVVEITPGVFEQLTSVLTVDLTQNALQTLPDDLQQVSFSNDSRLLLSANHWSCVCDTLWLSEWLRANDIVTDAGSARCQIPDHLRDRPIITITSDDLNCDIVSYYPLAITFGVLGIIVLICIPLLYHFRWETKVFLHAKFHIRPFDGKVRNLKDSLYDTFISYCNQDSAWVTGTLLPRLENHRPPFKVCIHQRDFQIGEAIADNITQAITSSHATVMVISEHFAESEWCMFEFQRAHHEMLQDNRRRLIAIVMSDIDLEGLPMDLKTYLKSNTYLSISDKWFWPKLLYALPDPPGLAEREGMPMEVYATERIM